MGNIFTDNIITQNYSLRLFLCSILLTLSSANFAFDNQGFGQTQAMTPFIKRFGDKPPGGGEAKLPSNFLSYSNAFPVILLVFGIGLGSMVSSTYGRRMTVFTMSLWAMACVPIIVTSKGRSQFLAARCLNSIYIGMEMSCIPVYQSEIVPARVRGLAVASYQMSFAVGGFVISAICHRTATIPNDWAWKIPFLCYLVVPFVVSTFIWFQPESPRWLASKGRIDQARRSLTILRKADHDVEHELEQMIIAVEAEKKLSTGSYAACFKGTNLRRTLIVLFCNLFLQFTGQALSSLYGPVIVKQLKTINPFNYTLINQGLSLFVYLINIVLNDYIGRRPIMLISIGLQSVFLFTLGGLGSAVQTKLVKQISVAFIILFTMAFNFGWAPLSYLISAETPSQQLRDKTTRMGFGVGVIFQFVVAFVLPYLMNDDKAGLHLKVGFIFGPIAACGFIWAFFCLPEYKGLRLEQIDLLFEERIPALKSRKWGIEHGKQTDIKGVDASGNIVTTEDGVHDVDRTMSNEKRSIDQIERVEHVNRV